MASQPRQRAGPYGWYVLIVLCLAYLLAFLDRQALSLLVEPIKHDLRLDDTEISLLQGLAFAICNGVLGLPLGRLVDTGQRVKIVAAAVACWSIMTACCGLAGQFWSLFACRMGVGVGEAALTPAAYSIITDSVPARRLGLALAVFTVGTQLGSGIAFIGGAAVFAHVSHSPAHAWPLIGLVQPWQQVFLVIGLPGLLVAMWILALREPPRMELSTGTAAADRPAPATPSVKNVLRFLRLRWHSLGALYLCMAFAAMASYALYSWAVSMFIRIFHLSIADAGCSFGLIVAVFGALGVLAGGMAGDAASGRFREGRLLVMMCASLAAAPIAAAAPLARTAPEALTLLAPLVFFMAMVIGLGPSALQEQVPNRMRGVATSVGVLIVNLLGLGIGPTAIALTTDQFFGDEHKLRYSLALLLPCMLLTSALFGRAGVGTLRRSRLRATVAVSETPASAGGAES